MANLLKNASFNLGTYEPKGQTSLVLPNLWEAGCLDNGNLIRYTKAGAEVYGKYNKKGPRNSDADHIKPEVLQITAVQPYLNPARTEPPDNAVTGFKLYGTICYWVMQVVSAAPGQVLSFRARAHAWSHMSEDPEKDAAKYSHGVGYGAFKALEGEAGLNDGQRNYRFRVGIDPYGGRDPFASAVVWGTGAHIYNIFDDVPEVKAEAKADQITVFMMADCLYGMVNSNSFWSRPVLEVVAQPPAPSGRGAPREQYERIYWVIPQDATPQRAAAIMAEAAKLRGTVGFSYDDAGIGDLDKRKAVLFDILDISQKVFLDWYAKWYPGVTVEFRDPKAGGPGPQPPKVIYRVPNNKGGVHVVGGSRNGYGPFLQKLAKAGRPLGLVKDMRAGATGEAKAYSGGKTYTVWRWFAGKEHEDDTPPSNWQWPIEDTVRMAREWMATLYPLWEKDRQHVDFWEFMNEPDPADIPAMEHAVAFVQACMEDAEAHGYKTAIWSWTAGLPRDPSIKPGECAQMTMMLPTLKWAAEHGHVYSVHDGSISEERRLFRQGYEDKTALRYRYAKAMMDARGWPMPYVVITEAYQVDGYHKPDWNDWKWYLTELGKDGYVLGCAWFTLGDWDFSPGQNVNIQDQLDRFADCMLSVPKPAPVPEPDPVDDLGWCSFATKRSLTEHNYWNGRSNQVVKAVCLHIADGPMSAIYPTFNRVGGSSAHFAISKSGLIEQYVSIHNTAWANGLIWTGTGTGWKNPRGIQVAPTWERIVAGINPNYHTISIEHEGRPGEAWTSAMLNADAKLLWWIEAQTGLAWQARVSLIGHNMIDPIDRPNCPGSGITLQAVVNAVYGMPMPKGKALVGLHMRADGPNTDNDFAIAREAKIEAALIQTSTPPEDFDRLVAMGIKPENILLRLFADMSDRVISAPMFASWMLGPLDWFSKRGGRLVQIHNEPNLAQEGLGRSWQDAKGFAVWYGQVLTALRAYFPNLLYGFPGLSPQPETPQWIVDCRQVIEQSDWIGVHAYWQTPEQMTELLHGGYWQHYLFLGGLIYITEFANVNPLVSKLDKASQYIQYWSILPEPMVMAVSFVSSASDLNFAHECWNLEMARLVGARR